MASFVQHPTRFWEIAFWEAKSRFLGQIRLSVMAILLFRGTGTFEECSKGSSSVVPRKVQALHHREVLKTLRSHNVFRYVSLGLLVFG